MPSFARLAVCLISTFAECIISEAGDTACRMAHLRAAVAHVVSGCGNIALRVGNTDKTLYAVILKRGGNITVRTALLDGLQGLATAIGMGSLNIEKISKIQGKYPLISPDEF